jgi:hypothetical protein
MTLSSRLGLAGLAPVLRRSAHHTVFGLAPLPKGEVTMQRQADRDKIAEEAVGQRDESAPPYGPAQRVAARG